MGQLKAYVPKTPAEAVAVLEWLQLGRPVHCYSSNEVWFERLDHNTALVKLKVGETTLIAKEDYAAFVSWLRGPFQDGNLQLVEVEFKHGQKYMVDALPTCLWVHGQQNYSFDKLQRNKLKDISDVV